MNRYLTLCLGLLLVNYVMATDISPSQFLLAKDSQPTEPAHHEVHLQAPNDNQGRVIVIGPQDIQYNVRLLVNVAGEGSREARCDFAFDHMPQQKTPTCILDFSDSKETKIINLKDENEIKNP